MAALKRSNRATYSRFRVAVDQVVLILLSRTSQKRILARLPKYPYAIDQ
jgi:hypothetical protein